MDYLAEDGDIPVDPLKKPPGRPIGSFRPKMTKIERLEFIKESSRKILEEHMSYTDYINWCHQTKNISKTQSNEYWLSTWSTIRKKFNLDKDKLVMKHIHNYWRIHSQALEQRDLTNARQVLNDLAKLQGLNEPDKVEVRGTQIKLNFGNPEGNND